MNFLTGFRQKLSNCPFGGVRKKLVSLYDYKGNGYFPFSAKWKNYWKYVATITGFNYSHLIIFRNNLLKYAITIKWYRFESLLNCFNDSILHLGGFH